MFEKVEIKFSLRRAAHGVHLEYVVWGSNKIHPSQTALCKSGHRAKEGKTQGEPIFSDSKVSTQSLPCVDPMSTNAYF